MTQFTPSDYGDLVGAYGAEEGVEEETSATQQAADALTQFAPAISSLVFGGDPRQQYQKKKAALDNYKVMHNKASSSFLRNIYAMKIRSLTAELQALEEQVGEERIAVAATQAAKVSGIVLVGAGALAVLVIANFFRQKAKTERLQQRVLRQQLG
jgi:hypothetical protein